MRNMLRCSILSLLWGILVASVSTDYCSAQLDVGYRPFYPVLPPEATGTPYVNDLKLVVDEQGQPIQAFVVGRYGRTDRTGQQAFVYDHFGFIDPAQPEKFWDIQELVGPNPPAWAPATHTRSSFIGINESGRICGSISSDAGNDPIGVYFDLNSRHWGLQKIPIPTASTVGAYVSSSGRRMNKAGDILVTGNAFQGSEREIFIYNPDTGENIVVPKLAGAYVHFNSQREVVASTSDIYDSGVFRHTVFRHKVVDTNGDGISEGETEEFPYLELTDKSAINEFSQISGLLTLTIRVNKRQNRYEQYAARIGANGSVEWDTGSASTYNWVGDINDSGDMLHRSDTGLGAPTRHLFHEGDPLIQGDEKEFLVIDELIIGGAIPGGTYTELSNRDNTGFGWICGRADIDGDGLLDRMLLLIPELLEPVPGISVNPTFGLVTTEDGGSGSFDVVLQTQPIADVTIAISSSDLTEGTVDKANLTFTPDNWDIPQTVTVTGVDDLIEDGDVAYTIVTAPASSTDPDYNGLDVDDVQVTNLDNDGPRTYHSEDTPLAIPDNNPLGVSSDIDVNDNFQIAGLIVTLDISHERPSDLAVYLYGPDANDPPVQLFNFSGDNHVPAFNGTITLGLWTLKVYDTRRGRTGALNSWSLTVD
jgi:hypothetical protein